MTEGQWFGVVAVLVGIYLVVCSTWAHDFVLYRLKVERATMIMNEMAAHVMYFILGVAAIVIGILRILNKWVL